MLHLKDLPPDQPVLLLAVTRFRPDLVVDLAVQLCLLWMARPSQDLESGSGVCGQGDDGGTYSE